MLLPIGKRGGQKGREAPTSPDGEQTVDEVMAEGLERSYGRKLADGTANLSEEERQHIQGKRAHSKR
jgi:hypothetical protein